MTYNVVIFKKDNTVEAVPSHWLSRDEKTCAWPNKNLNPSRLIEKKSFPNTFEYKWYKVRSLLKDIGKEQYLSYKYILYIVYCNLNLNFIFITF